MDEKTVQSNKLEIEIAICPECMYENLPSVDFCKKCGRPMGLITTIDPLRRIHAQGWLYRKIVSGPVKPIAFWGMWMIFGPGLLMPIFFLFPRGRFDLGIACFFIPSALSAMILYRVTKNYICYRVSNKGKQNA
ncbi:MAG: hypothetical protein KAV18_04710 [Candidatus Omnitrophica bacterium]|nr:hypothetical protein [Candidatus Omnitrophota bacterium]MCK4423354.1 hypothetical protein [Candidatus Omnitrophota bacterium]